MNSFSLILIALGLSMDAFAVSVSSGLAIDQLKIKHAILIATFFGLFQGIMPIIGWLLGYSVSSYIEKIDHWIAFSLLCFIGGKMIFEALQLDESSKQFNPLNIYVLFLLSIATSIDALAIGISFAVLKIMVVMPALLIGIVTFFFSLLGVFIGDTCGHFFEKKIEIFGGFLLIGIGLKIVVEHVFFS